MRALALLLAALLLLPGAGGQAEAPVAAAACAATDPVPPLLAGSGLVRQTEDPGAGTWRTWFVPVGSVPVPPPPATASVETAQELAELEQWDLDRTADQARDAQDIDAGPALRVALEAYFQLVILDGSHVPTAAPGVAKAVTGDVRGAVTSREAMLLAGAMFDALAAAWQAKYCYQRPAPYALDPALRPAVRARPVPSYPSEHAVVAGVADVMLRAWFPCDPHDLTTCELLPSDLEAWEHRVMDSRVIGGGNYRSDLRAGFALGQAVAQRALDARAGDGSAMAWDGAPPVGPCRWQPTSSRGPASMQWGQVEPFLLARGDALRPPAPAACDGPAYVADMHAAWDAARNATPGSEARARAEAWAGGQGTETIGGLGLHLMLREADGADMTTMQASRALAHVAAAGADALIAAWDAKAAWWSERPQTAIQRLFDPSFTPAVATPPMPADGGDQAAVFPAELATMAHFLPARADALRALGEEAARAPVDAGTESPWHVAQGEAIGAGVAQAALARAAQDGGE